MLNFDRNLMNLFGSCEKLPKDPGGNILVKYLSRMWYLWAKNMKAGLCKLEFCTEANQTLPFKSLQNNFLHSRPLHGANISQIFSFTRTASSHNIQFVPVFKTYLPTFLLKVLLNPELWLPLFNLSPNINQK